MKKKQTRREFIKVTAAASAAAGIGVTLFPGMTFADQQGGTNWHKSVCRYCGVGCGVMIGEKGGKIVKVKGDAQNTINKGHLCVKAFYLPKAVNAKTRLHHPMIRKNGKLVKASWDEAMDLVATKFNKIHMNP